MEPQYSRAASWFRENILTRAITSWLSGIFANQSVIVYERDPLKHVSWSASKPGKIEPKASFNECKDKMRPDMNQSEALHAHKVHSLVVA